MLIRVEDNNCYDTESSIKEAALLAKKLGEGVVYYDEERGQNIEVNEDSTLESVARYYGWDQ